MTVVCCPAMEEDSLDKRLRKIFDACDGDGDGFISVEDLRNAMSSSGLGDPSSFLGDIEATEDGMVAFEGFQKAVLKLQNQLEVDIGNDEYDLDELSGEECVDAEDSECGASGSESVRTGRERSVASSKDEGFINDDGIRETEVKKDFEGFGEGDDVDAFVDAESTQGRAFGSTHQRKAQVRSLHSSQQSSLQSSEENIGDAVNSLDVTNFELEQQEEISKMTKKVEELNSQLEVAATDTRKSVDVYTQLKAENNKLVERLYHLEEQVREMEILKSEKQSVEVDLRKAMSELSKQQHERQRDNESFLTQINEANSERDAAQRKEKELQRKLLVATQDLEKMKTRINELNTREQELAASMQSEREAWKTRMEEAAEREESLRQEISDLEQQLEVAEGQLERPRTLSFEDSSREEKLIEENKIFKQQIEELNDQIHELRAQFIQQGQMLIDEEQTESLAAEMETASKDEMMVMLQDLNSKYQRVRSYTEGLLVTIIDKHPELLEKK